MLKLPKIVLIGGGGHCKVIIDAIRKARNYEIIGIIDCKREEKEVLDIKIIGDDSKLKKIFVNDCRNAFVSVGSVGDTAVRHKLAKMAERIGFKFPIIIHPSAVVANDIKIGEGTFVGPGVVLSPGVKIGKHVIINSKVSVDHDCKIGDFVHLAPGVTLSGGVKVGKNTHLGTGTSVLQGINIGQDSIVGVGSVIVKNVSNWIVLFGNPCRKVRDRKISDE